MKTPASSFEYSDDYEVSLAPHSCSLDLAHESSGATRATLLVPPHLRRASSNESILTSAHHLTMHAPANTTQVTPAVASASATLIAPALMTRRPTSLTAQPQEQLAYSQRRLSKSLCDVTKPTATCGSRLGVPRRLAGRLWARICRKSYTVSGGSHDGDVSQRREKFVTKAEKRLPSVSVPGKRF